MNPVLLQRFRAAAIHLVISAIVAGLTALLILQLWYPKPWGDLSGGKDLFWLVLGVDIVLGPLITLAIFDVRKPRTELMRDLAVVGALQLAALAYGLHTVAQARPAMLVLEKDRIRALRAIDLGAPELAQAPAGLQQLSWTGFTRAATRAVTNEEFVEAGTAAAAGIDIGMRPKFWRPPDQTAQAWREAAKPLATLRALHPTKTALIDEAVSATGRDPAQVGYLAILARSSAYVALIDTKSGDIVGYAPVDGN